MYYRRKLKNSGTIDRPKAFLGALIGAGTTIASAIINSNAQKEQARLQHKLDLKNKAIEEANNIAQAYNLTENAQKAYEQQFRIPYAKGGRRKLRHGIQITDGGYAIPIGDNTYLLRGSSHQDINETGKTGIGIRANDAEIEAENGEVLQKKGKQLRIFSNRLNDNGETPAREVLEGKNKDKVFARQQAKNGGSSLVEGMRTKAVDGIGGWLSSLFNNLSVDAMTDSINSARDTVSNARAAIRRMGTDTTRTSKPNSTTVSNKDTIARTRQAALQEIMAGNPDGPNNRQLNAMVANGTIETAFGDEPMTQPATPATNTNRQPVVSNPSNGTVTQQVSATPANTYVNIPTAPTRSDIPGLNANSTVKELEDYYNSTPIWKLGRETISYPNGVTITDTAQKEFNERINNLGIRANKFVKDNNLDTPTRTTRDFDLGADFKPVDFANAGIGVLGSILSHAITRSSLRGLEKYAPTRPALYRAGKLVTNYNINPQLTNLERVRQQGYNTIDSNTSSSVAALDKRNTLGLNTALATNELYGTKYNTEAELLNKDTLNQQEVANKNVEAYNQYMNDRRNYLAGLATRRSLSNVGLIQGIGSSLSNMIQSGMDRYDNNNEIGVILSAAYPESINYIRRNNPRLARRLGIG